MDRKSSSNVERAAEILLAIGDAGPHGCTLSDLSSKLNDTKSAVHRALSGLAKFGFVEQSSRRGRYRLGPAVYSLANSSYSITDIVAMLRPALVAISAATHMSTYLMARSGLDCVCLDFQEGIYPIRALLSGVGGRIPLGVSVAGVCILSTLDPATRRAILAQNRPHLDRWKLDPEEVFEETEAAAAVGYAVRPGVQEEGELLSFAVLIPTEKIHAAAAIAVIPPWSTAPSEKIDEMVATIRAAIAGEEQALVPA